MSDFKTKFFSLFSSSFHSVLTLGRIKIWFGSLIAIWLIGGLVVVATINSQIDKAITQAHSLSQLNPLMSFEDISKQVNQTEITLAQLNWSLNWLSPFRLIPIWGQRLSQATQLITIAHDSLNLVSNSLNILRASQPDLPVSVKFQDYLSWRATSRLPDPQRFNQFYALTDNFTQKIPGHINLLSTLVNDSWWQEKIGPTRIIQVSNAVKQLEINWPKWSKFWQEYSQPIKSLYPFIAGYEHPAELFFVIQNNNEIRATGGFFGTYGQLIIDQGKVGVFKTDNIYSLDYPAKEKVTRVPPSPITKYLLEKTWFMRDGNWYPDWPMSAELIQNMYAEQTGKNTKFTAVIAINPNLIKSLLSLTGPIVVEGQKFDADNLLSLLEETVGRDYKALGLNIFNRKLIIDKLKTALVEQLFSLEPEALNKIPNIIAEAIKTRSLMAWSGESLVQTWIEAFGFDGRLKTSDDDFLGIFDSNLGSLKSDPAINRSAKIARVPNQPQRRILTLTYEHKGKFDWKTTRYRNWLRVYVPNGSKLISSQGLLVMDRSAQIGTPEIYSENNFTVLAGFTNIEPGQTKTVTWIYDVPDNIAGDKLFFRAQPGIQRSLTLQGLSGTLSSVKNLNADNEFTW